MRMRPQDDSPTVLLVGDAARAEAALRGAIPNVRVEVSPDYFHAIAHLGSSEVFDGVVAPVGPIEHRAQAALENLRAAAGEARVVLVSEPDGEILARKLVDRGCDDYLIWPVGGADLAAALEGPVEAAAAVPAPRVRGSGSSELPVAEIVLDALVRDPGDAVRAAIDELNRHLPGGARLFLSAAAERAPFAPAGASVVARPLGERVLHLVSPRGASVSEGVLGEIAAQLERALQLQLRSAGLQKLAITDDLTGIYNCRYFKHGLDRILERAKEGKFPVTLLLFDIDGFKKYNDQFGHAAGDEILRQTAQMMKRCVRDHDLVARLGGDEFAVVFWEKDGQRAPRPHGPGQAPSPSRPPTSPQLMFERFRKMVSLHDFEALGSSGKGQLTISGGLAVYPYDATTAKDLICAADRALMFGAKKSGKNMLHLVGQPAGDEGAVS